MASRWSKSWQWAEAGRAAAVEEAELRTAVACPDLTLDTRITYVDLWSVWLQRAEGS